MQQRRRCRASPWSWTPAGRQTLGASQPRRQRLLPAHCLPLGHHLALRVPPRPHDHHPGHQRVAPQRGALSRFLLAGVNKDILSAGIPKPEDKCGAPGPPRGGTLPQRSQHCELEAGGRGEGESRTDTEFPRCGQASCQLCLWALRHVSPGSRSCLSCRGLSFYPSYMSPR